MTRFTEAEINLICIYDTANRQQLLADLQSAAPYIYEKELKQLVEKIISKLLNMSDAEFAEIDFVPMIGGDDIEQ